MYRAPDTCEKSSRRPKVERTSRGPFPVFYNAEIAPARTYTYRRKTYNIIKELRVQLLAPASCTIPVSFATVFFFQVILVLSFSCSLTLGWHQFVNIFQFFSFLRRIFFVLIRYRNRWRHFLPLYSRFISVDYSQIITSRVTYSNVFPQWRTTIG